MVLAFGVAFLAGVFCSKLGEGTVGRVDQALSVAMTFAFGLGLAFLFFDGLSGDAKALETLRSLRFGDGIANKQSCDNLDSGLD